MTKYVDIDAAKEAVRKAECDAAWDGRRFDAEFIENALDFIPRADVAPVVHGQWETNSDRPDSLICSVCKCGFDMWKHDPHNFCPNCGAKMDGGVDNETD